jgi:hypothetical protein
MSLPGFTAEASLYRTSERYQFAPEWTDNNSPKVITPQIGPAGAFEQKVTVLK